MNKRFVTLLVILVLAIVSAGGYWYWETRAVPIPVSDVITVSAKQKEKQAFSGNALPEALVGVTPEFIKYDYNEYDGNRIYTGKIPSPTLLKIKNEAAKILDNYYPPDGPGVSGADVYLYAVAPRYIIASVPSPKDTGSPLQIIDLKRQTVSELPENIEFTVGDTAIIFGLDNIYRYRLNTPAAVPVANAELSEDETYDHCGGCLGSPEIIETHTTTTATVSVWKWVSQMPVKTRDFSFPIQ